MAIKIIIPAESTRELRRDVLRPHQSIEELTQEEDPDAICFGAIDEDGDVVISTATLQRARAPFSPDPVSSLSPQWRIRAMATREDRRAGGVGRSVLDSVIDCVSHTGGGFLWCSARVGALSFYERAGFKVYGEEFLEPHIGAHRYMWRAVDPAGNVLLN